jgi:hypothetical protein
MICSSPGFSNQTLPNQLMGPVRKGSNCTAFQLKTKNDKILMHQEPEIKLGGPQPEQEKKLEETQL